MATASDIKTSVSSFFRFKPAPKVKTSTKIHRFTAKAFKSTGGAPPALVDMYRAHGSRYIKK